MKRYTVAAKCTISIYTVVEADNVAQALLLAQARQVQHLPIDSADRTLEWCHSGELDGEPVGLYIDEGTLI